MTYKRHIFIWGVLALFATASAAYGDTGIPLLPVACSGMLLTLVPVAMIEAVVIRRRLSKPFRECVNASFAANGISTVAGIPLTWVVLFIIELCAGGGAYGLETWPKRVFAVTAQAAWLIPYEGDLGWMIPAALAFMLIPFFFVSIALEHWTITWMWKDFPRKLIFRAVLIGNIITYVLLAGLLVVQLQMATHVQH